jgi:naphtho-gamma-pyrone polyketide synthase
VGFDVGKMKVDSPLILRSDDAPQLLRLKATAKWSSGIVFVEFSSSSGDAGRITSHATCEVRIVQNQTWQLEWKKNAYLIRSRIASLRRAVDEGDSHKVKRRMAYKLFSVLVDYDEIYQGMQEVVFDSEELEATARVTFQVDEHGFVFNPCWIDSLGHIAGFVMNGTDVHSKTEVFINHGWDAMRCAVPIQRGKTYQTYNKMQHSDGKTYIGDTYILDGDSVIAIFEGVKVSQQ